MQHRRALQLATALLVLARCWLAAGQSDEDFSSFYLDALRDRAVGGTLRSVIAQVSSQGDPQPEVQLSSFLSLGCLQIANLSSFECQVTRRSSRLDCLSWCEGLQVNARLPQNAFLRSTECACCSNADLEAVEVLEPGACDQLCEDQEDDIYGAPAFAGAARRQAACGAKTEEVYSAFRQWDGMSPLGRRGAFSSPFGIWYEVVAAQLPSKVVPQNLPNFSDSTAEWQTYGTMQYFLHAVHVETGWPVFAHQMPLGFLPECLHYDGFRRQVVALLRSTAGGVHVAVLCPSCSDEERLVKVIEALSDAEAEQFELAMPACTFDAEQRQLALVVVPLEDRNASDKASVLEVSLLQDNVTWKASNHFEEVLALESCRPMPQPQSEEVEPKGFTALLADGSEDEGGEFLLAEPSDLVKLDGQDLTRCGNSPCAGVGPTRELVYLAGSASHPTHSFVFFAVEPGGENFSSDDTIDTRIAQSRCDGGSSGAFLWNSVTNGERVALEAPFDRTDPGGLMLPAPRLVLAEFLSSGRQVMLSFDRPTLMGAVPSDTDGDGLADAHQEADAWRRNFPCSWVVGVKSLQDLQLGSSNCTWMTEQELVIDLPIDGPAEIGSPFFLRSGVIFAYAPVGKYSPPASGAVYLVPPQSEARAPEPVVSGPRLVDYCSTLELDASASRYTAGQPNVTWQLSGVKCHPPEGAEPEGYCNTTLLELALQDATSALLLIEASERPPELKSVSIEAVVTNRWGVSASEVVEVNISQVPKPTVDITTSPPSPNPFSGLAMRATIKQSGCVQTPLRYSWRLVSVSASSAASSATSAEALEGRAMEMWQSSSGGALLGLGWNSSNLLFPPLSLAAGVIYHFELTVEPTLVLPGYASTENVSVQIDPSPLQMTFRQPLLVIRKDQAVEVDMSPSFDPDSPEAVLPAPNWTCKALDPEDACPTALTQALAAEVPFCYEAAASGAVACRVRGSVLRVAGHSFSANVKVQLVAQVQADVVQASDPWWRSPSLLTRVGIAAAEVVVQVQDDSLTALAPITVWIVSLSQFRLNEHEPLRLEGFALDEATGQGTSDGYSNLQYHWAIERLNSNPAWEAARAAIEGSAYQVPEEIYSPVPSTQAQLDTVSSSSLTLPEKALFPGVQYRFVLNVSDISNPSRFTIAATEIKVTQSQPHLGSLRVSPARGTSGLTEFTLEAYGWSAEEDCMPLLYDFGYLDQQGLGMAGPSIGGGPAEVRLGSGPRALLVTRDLPAGDITFFVDVYTTWGGSLRATANVTVSPWPVSNATAQRLSDALSAIELADPAAALSQLPVLLSQFPEGGNVSNSQLMSSFLSTWSKSRDRLLSSSVSGLPSWPPPGLGLTVATLMESLRPLCWRFVGAEAQLECTKGMRPLVAAAFPSPAVIDQLRLMPERCPEPVLQPEKRLASSLIRSLTDVAFMDTAGTVEAVRRLQSNSEGAAPDGGNTEEARRLESNSTDDNETNQTSVTSTSAPTLQVDRLRLAGEILASAAQVGVPSGWTPDLRVSSRPLAKPSRRSVSKASKEVESLLADFREEPPPIARQLWSQLHLEEQSLKHIQKQLQRTAAAHVRRLERAYVEEAQQNLPDEVSTGMLLLAYLGAMGVFTAGAGCTMNYWSWISGSALGDYMGAIIGSMAVVSILEMLRMGLVLCVALARLETRRRATQARWTRKHPEILEVKPATPLGAASEGPPGRRWPLTGLARPPPPPPRAGVKVTRSASAASAVEKGGFWALPRMLQRFRRGAKVSPERDAEQKSSKRWKILRKVGTEEDGAFGVVPAPKAQGGVSADEVRRQVEEREAEQVAAMMNMVPPWAEAHGRYQTAGAATVRRAQEAWSEAKSQNTKKTKSSRVRFDMSEDMRPIVPNASAPSRRTKYQR